jgi:hypothetical protein
VFKRNTRRLQNQDVQAAHPAIASFLASAGSQIADRVEPVVHSTLDHWVSLSIMFVVACVLFWASANGLLP